MFGNRMRHTSRRLHSEDGSIVVALLAVIVVSGLIMSIAAGAVASHRGVNRNRDRARIVQHADAGVDEAIYQLSHPSTSASFKSSLPISSWTTPSGMPFEWRITAASGDAGSWLVESRTALTTNAGTSTRTVSAVVSQPKQFQLAAFADSNMTLRGGNSANSYGSAAWNTGEGNLGSNGTITLNGNVTADDVELHNWDADPVSTRCTSSGNSLCSGADYIGPKTDVSSDEALGFIDDAVAAYCPASPPAFTGTTLAPGIHCFSTMTLSSNFTISGTGQAIVYLTNPTTSTTFSVGRKLLVNCDLCTGTGGPRPDASRLQIFTKSYGGIKIGNHAHVAASIYAPRATCGGNPSNAGANFYGSMVCGIVTSQGAWSFHYDDRLRDVGTGGWHVKRWAEE